MKVPTSDLFTKTVISSVWESKDPYLYLSIYIEDYIRRKYSIIDTDSNFISSICEFHLNNLIYLKEVLANEANDEAVSDLMNVLSRLLSLHANEDTNNREDEKEGNVQIHDDLLSLEGIHNETNNSNSRSLFLYNTDVLPIIKDKINTLKLDFKSVLSKHNLKLDVFSKILSFLNKTFFPYFKLYYYFCNIERDEELHKIEFIINKPLEVLQLSAAERCIDHIEENEKNEKVKKEEVKRKEKEEEEKAALKRVDEERIELEKERMVEDMSQKRKERSYKDLLDELGMTEETRGLIIEAIERMNLEINGKINDRQKKLEERLKEVEEMMKGKKK